MIQQVHSRPHVYLIQVDLPDNPLRTLNVYILRAGGHSLVIDTGFNRPECRAALLAGLEELKLDWDRTALFLTHLHSDHIGLVHLFLKRGCPIYMSRIDHAIACLPHSARWSGLEYIFHREGFPQALIARQDMENQARVYAPEIPFPVTEVEDRDRLQVGPCELVCIHTPGHTPGHMVLYQPKEQILFSGDHVLFHITPNISKWEGVPDALADYLNSLSMMKKFPVRHIFPAHRTLEGDFYRRLNELACHHANRLKELLCTVEACPGASAYELAGRLTWSARGLGWEYFPPHQKWFAMGETLAHLDYLTARNQIVRTVQSDRISYYIKSCYY